MHEADKVVSLGALSFRFVQAGHTELSPIKAIPLREFDGTEMALALEEGCSFLIVDHRSDPEGAGVCRVELWESVTVAESGPVPLLAVCDSPTDRRATFRAENLRELVAHLRRQATLLCDGEAESPDSRSPGRLSR
jgi:hypothetical protein